MNFFQLFFYKILENIFQNAPIINCTIFKIFSGEHASEPPPPSNAWFRQANTSTFQKKYFELHRNEILDTSLKKGL